MSDYDKEFKKLCSIFDELFSDEYWFFVPSRLIFKEYFDSERSEENALED